MRSGILSLAILSLALATGALAAPTHPAPTPVRLSGDAVPSALQPASASAAADTACLLGGPGRDDGRFETADGDSAWWGWTHAAVPPAPIPHWHVSDYNVPRGGGDFAMWCGATYGNGCNNGYGNNWDDVLLFTQAAPTPTAATTVRVTGILNCDTERDYDFVRFQANRGGAWQDLVVLDHLQVGYELAQTIEFAAADYVDGDQIQLRFRFTSDVAVSDEDGLLDTKGAVQVDNLTVAIAGGPTIFEDFEDQVGDRWLPQAAPADDPDYTHLERDLPDPDPSLGNASWQVCWRGYQTSGTPLQQNLAISPALAMPDRMHQALVAMDVTVNAADDGRQMCYIVQVRSTADADPAALAIAPWRSYGFMYYGDPGHYRHQEYLGDLLAAGARWLQVGFGIMADWSLLPMPDDGEYTPYLDNVAVKAWTGGLVANSTPTATTFGASAVPNPFNPRTTIALELPAPADASLRLYDLAGRLVRVLQNGPLAAGRHEFLWDGTGDDGRGVAAGIYVYEARAVGQRLTGKLALVR